MSEYKGIQGNKVRNYTSDPDNPKEGQVWYNETSNTLKVFSVSTVGSWSTGANMNVGRYALAGAGASNSAGLAFGGNFPPGDNLSALTESYDGTSWTEVGDLNTARQNISGNVIYTSALAMGGSPPVGGQTEEWNGAGSPLTKTITTD